MALMTKMDYRCSHVFHYHIAVELNNVGVQLLKKRQYARAEASFTEAIEQMKCFLASSRYDSAISVATSYQSNVSDAAKRLSAISAWTSLDSDIVTSNSLGSGRTFPQSSSFKEDSLEFLCESGDASAGPLVYAKPATLPVFTLHEGEKHPSSQEVAATVLYNKALAHHVEAILEANHSKKSRNSLLLKAKLLYRVAFSAARHPLDSERAFRDANGIMRDLSVVKLLNNLGHISHLLGDDEYAMDCMNEMSVLLSTLSRETVTMNGRLFFPPIWFGFSLNSIMWARSHVSPAA